MQAGKRACCLLSCISVTDGMQKNKQKKSIGTLCNMYRILHGKYVDHKNQFPHTCREPDDVGTIVGKGCSATKICSFVQRRILQG